MIAIIKAKKEDIPEIAPLFDQYRVFYKQTSDLSAATSFLEDRFDNQESILFLALYNDKAVGFTQLYTTFSSVTLQPVYILNDLYVASNFRGKGIGEKLLLKAKKYCLQTNYKGLALETAVDNPAKRLYEKLGWKKDAQCFHYFWTAKYA